MDKMSQTEYAKHRGVSKMAVSKAIKSGRITLTKDGKINPLQADDEWKRNTSSTHKKGMIAPSLSESQAIERAYKARMAKIEYEEKIGKLVSQEDVEKEAFQAARLVRDNMLLIGHTIGNQLALESNPKKCEDIVTNKIKEVLKNIAQQ